MKKMFAAFAAGLMLASAVPVLAAGSDEGARPGYCWQEADSQAGDGWYCGGRGHGHRGYCWDAGNADKR